MIFGGMRPSRGTDVLAVGEAQLAQNVRLSAGELRPLNGLLANITLTSGGTVRSVYRFGQALSSISQYWFQATTDTDFVKGPVANDTSERTYWTDWNGTTGYPKKTDATLATVSTPYPSSSYAMGLPAPAAAPTVSVSGTATNAADPGEAVVYVYTYVSAWGEEGPPSQPSSVVTWRAGQTLNVSGLSVAPGTGPQNQNYSVNGKRLYRSATGSQATQYQLTNTGVGATIPLATTTYTDTSLTAALGDVLSTLGWIEPPYNMQGLCAGSNGVMAGFAGNTVCFSVPFAPYAWPLRYQQATDAIIVGIAWIDQTLFVGTTMGLYMYACTDPANVSGGKLPVVQSVVSKRSIVAMRGAILFASSDGLYSIDASGVPANLTAGIMTRADWQAYAPASITAFESDDRYVAFYDNGVVQASLVFSFGASPSFTQSDVYATAGYRDKKSASLFVVEGGGYNLKHYDAGSPLTYTWTSGVLPQPSDTNAAAAMVVATAYPVTFSLYADGVLVGTPTTVTSRYPFRLPSGYRTSRYHIRLSGSSNVHKVELASSMSLLGQ